MGRHAAKETPTRLYYYTAKIVTPASREIVGMVAPIAWIGEFSMSFQSLNPDARRAVKRTNISMDKLESNVEWARERGIKTSSEMIYGFPHERPETFFEGVEELMRGGINTVTIYPLQLFPGIDLAGKSVRESCGFETRFRLADGAFGVYDNGSVPSAEAEEVVVATRWSTEDDYFLVRRYGFFMQLLFGRGYFHELSKLCSEIGISIEPIIRHLTLADYSEYPVLAKVLADHRSEAEFELKRSRREVYDEFTEQVGAGGEVSGLKLNLVTLGKIMSSEAAIYELLDLVGVYFKGLELTELHMELVSLYLFEVLRRRLVILKGEVEKDITFGTRFDYLNWVTHNYDEIGDVVLSEPRMFGAVAAEVIRRNLKGFGSDNRFDLQSIFDRTANKFLMRSVVPSIQCCVVTLRLMATNKRGRLVNVAAKMGNITARNLDHWDGIFGSRSWGRYPPEELGPVCCPHFSRFGEAAGLAGIGGRLRPRRQPVVSRTRRFFGLRHRRFCTCHRRGT